MAIAVFDFDGTLYRGDSFVDFGKFALGRWRFYANALRALPWIAAWKAGLIANQSAKQRLFGFCFKGWTLRRFTHVADAFAKSRRSSFKEDVVEKLRGHISAGHRVIVVSASIEEWVRPVMASIGVDEVLATQVEVNSRGILTGKFSSPNCYGPEKVRRLRVNVPDLERNETFVYGDSAGDRELMLLADHPILIT